MFGWLFGKKSNRAIFRFHDGVKSRSIDPIAAQMAIDAHEKFNPKKHLEWIKSGTRQQRVEATQIACDAIRRAFGVSEYNEATREGMTVPETLALGAAFQCYLDSLKKNTVVSRT